MYRACCNFKVCVIWALDVPMGFHKWLESLWFIWSFDNHLSMYDCVGFSVLVLLFINVWLWMAPSCAAVMQLANQ